MGRGLGCLGVLLVIGLLAGELYVLLVVSQKSGDILGPVLALVALSVIGFKLTGFHVKRLPAAFLSGQPGRRLVGLIGGVLVAFPGFVTGAIGLVLQIPLIQRLFSRVGNLAAAGIARRAMSSMLGGKGGLPGGFPGAMPGFPGLKPDDRTPFNPPGGAPKTYDVKPEK